MQKLKISQFQFLCCQSLAEALLRRATEGDDAYAARTLIRAGVRAEVDVDALVPRVVTREVCDAYRGMRDDAQRTAFLVTLARDMNLDNTDVSNAVSAAVALG